MWFKLEMVFFRWWDLCYEESVDSKQRATWIGERGDSRFIFVYSSQSASPSWSCYYQSQGNELLCCPFLDPSATLLML